MRGKEDEAGVMRVKGCWMGQRREMKERMERREYKKGKDGIARDDRYGE